ncbi:MAG: DUF4389 domain-containing protein [Chromatiales bacterium]|nr:DUF4389 domain-containing protein [Chromatiales bacterium]
MAEEAPVGKETRTNEIWFRGLYMLLFLVIHGLVKAIVVAMAVVQFIFAAATGEPNRPLRRFGQGLSTYLYETTQFLTFNSERKPFPFDEWRNEPPREETMRPPAEQG